MQSDVRRFQCLTTSLEVRQNVKDGVKSMRCATISPITWIRKPAFVRRLREDRAEFNMLSLDQETVHKICFYSLKIPNLLFNWIVRKHKISLWISLKWIDLQLTLFRITQLGLMIWALYGSNNTSSYLVKSVTEIWEFSGQTSFSLL